MGDDGDNIQKDVRKVVLSCLKFWQEDYGARSRNDKHNNADATTKSSMLQPEEEETVVATDYGSSHHVHAQCSIIQVNPIEQQEVGTTSQEDNTSISTTNYTTMNGTLFSLPREISFEIASIRLVQAISLDDETTQPISSYRAASIQIVMSQHQMQQLQSMPFVTGWMVLLKDRMDQWQCISGAFYVNHLYNKLPPRALLVQPTDITDVLSCVWDKYCASNRACDGNGMAQVFHRTCRLTYVDKPHTRTTTEDNIKDDGIRVMNCESFCNMVSNRYITEHLHIPFAHLQNDPIVCSGDEVLGIEFAVQTPYIAMITLKVGHPPFLWTDVLTCAKLCSSDLDGKATAADWYIVHKSSTSEPFLTHLARSVRT